MCRGKACNNHLEMRIEEYAIDEIVAPRAYQRRAK